MRHHPILKLISAMNNLVNNNNKKTEPLIMYSANDHLMCLNNWEDEHYFTRAFQTLYPFEDSRYLAKRKIVILLQV